MNVKSTILIFLSVVFFGFIDSAPAQAHVECEYGAHILKIRCAASDELFKKKETCLDKKCSVKVSRVDHPIGKGANLSVLYFDFAETPTSPDMYMNRVVSVKDGVRDYGIFVNEELSASGVLAKNTFIDALKMTCKGGIKPIEDVLSARIKDWYRALGQTGGANLTFQETTFALEEIPTTYDKNIKECVYNDIQAYGNWRITEQKIKDYCSVKPSVDDTTCPNITLGKTLSAQTPEAHIPEKKNYNYPVIITSVLGLLFAGLITRFVLRKV